MSKAEGVAVVVIAHGGSLDACLRSWLGIARNEHGERRAFTFGTASLSLVRVKTHSYRVFLLNDTCHLRCTQEGSGT